MPQGISSKSIRDPKTNGETSEFRELKQELDQLMVEMTEDISVKLEYETSGSNMDSGSMVAIHQNSHY